MEFDPSSILWITACILGVLMIPVILLSFLSRKSSHVKLQGKHVLDQWLSPSLDLAQTAGSRTEPLITGGSQGIGLELAKQCAAKGSDVTLLARKIDILNKAKTEVESCRLYPDSQRVQAISCDIASGYEAVETAIRKAEDAYDAKVHILINSAGVSINKYFEDLTMQQFQMMMNVNYFGAVYATRAVMDNMKLAKSGSVIFLSSQGGQVGFIGMTGYSPTKYALRGFAESLKNELLPFSINIGVVYPPDTETPGWVEENKDKVVECLEISETAGLLKPHFVAQEILKHIEAGTYAISIGIDGLMLDTVSSGMIPYDNAFNTFVQLYVSGIFRLIAMCYAVLFQGIVMKHKHKRKLYS